MGTGDARRGVRLWAQGTGEGMHGEGMHGEGEGEGEGCGCGRRAQARARGANIKCFSGEGWIQSLWQ